MADAIVPVVIANVLGVAVIGGLFISSRKQAHQEGIPSQSQSQSSSPSSIPRRSYPSHSPPPSPSPSPSPFPEEKPKSVPPPVRPVRQTDTSIQSPSLSKDEGKREGTRLPLPYTLPTYLVKATHERTELDKQDIVDRFISPYVRFTAVFKTRTGQRIWCMTDQFSLVVVWSFCRFSFYRHKESLTVC